MSWELYNAETAVEQKENRRHALVILCFVVIVVVAIFAVMA